MDPASRRAPSLASSLPSATLSSQQKSWLLSASLCHTLDRVNVLGDTTSGHTGCVNALSWANNGELLISGGDDTTVRLWRIDPSDSSREYPFVCNAVIHTGHRANIFNAQMLPNSSRIATVAGDGQVRISDAGSAVGQPSLGNETELTTRQANIRILRCHSGRVKRIVTEESPDLFLTVSEDGTVRQHDLRVSHGCQSGSCPTPLVRLDHELSTLALSPLTPYQFIVAGESPFGYLFDRRHAGRFLEEEWGMVPNSDNVTTCVRRFGRAAHGPAERRGHEHITGAKMASSNGHEATAYSGDAVYLYSTRDEPRSSSKSGHDSIVSPNTNANPAQNPSTIIGERHEAVLGPDTDVRMEEDIEQLLTEHGLIPDAPSSPLTGPGEDQEDGSDDEDDVAYPADEVFSNVPIILPRARFAGACNVETVKDVNFLGPRDDFVTSGSDDGNFFVWCKSTGKIHDILEGDGSVVNVVEGHPYLPLLAVSGIDTTVKLFAPAHGRSAFSRMEKHDDIVRRNTEASSRRLDLSSLFLQYAIARRVAEGNTGNENATQCTYQ
ncbi:WD40 repeat-like protein [Sparassis latifolia]